MSGVPRWVERPGPGRTSRGFTLLELVIVISLVVLLFLTAYWRLLPLRGDAEAAHVATTIGTLRSNLGLVVAERILDDSLEGATGLAEANPMALLARPPGNYLGEIEPGQDAEIPRGSWYFDPASRELRYRVRYPQYLEDAPASGPVELSWQVRLAYADRNTDGRYDAEEDGLKGVHLRELDNPEWDPPDPTLAQQETRP